MTLSFNEDDASQIYMPVRVLSLEIREGHYMPNEVALLLQEEWRSLLCQPNVKEGALALGKRAC